MDITTAKQELLQALEKVDTLQTLEQFHSDHLGKKGTIPGFFKQMKDVP
jgi:phenylalanyl-tRNA synthetase alpha subunit